MAAHRNARRTPIPIGSLVLGYCPMAPFAAAAVGAWIMAWPWPILATRLAIIWGAIILVFVAGVRRGYGFGSSKASTANEIATMLIYFVPGGLSLILADAGRPVAALVLLVVGFSLVAVLDRRAALSGNAPLHFARLRAPQMAIAVAALVALLAHLLLSAPSA